MSELGHQHFRTHVPNLAVDAGKACSKDQKLLRAPVRARTSTGSVSVHKANRTGRTRSPGDNTVQQRHTRGSSTYDHRGMAQR